ncbi:hypothetical protein [Megasphaera hominis]|jgi:hypothetical protein|uniref:Uncharacterized protein n=1 Tax=Megasphaera hominis TaxID=159836 RepID=A0ABR6VL56_9FIRM|nr:hypothetical protein [Megasphaera hominis]MBC3538019.1 hypothetical protein [Megasphaera hominis]
MTHVDPELIAQFHMLWDGFPGLARLITTKHEIIAANDIARKAGFVEGAICARVGAPESHRGCLLNEMVKTGVAQTQMAGTDKVKGWMPVAGHPDLLVHFTLFMP